MPPRPRPEILSIAPYTPGISKIAGANRIVKLSSNEGAFGPPPGAVAALVAAAAHAHRYPDGSAAALCAAIGAQFGLNPAWILCGAGSDDFLYLLAHVFGGAGTELIMTAHGFSIYEIAGKLAGCTIIKTPERARTADVDAILAAVSPRTKLVCLANPNNPTGTMLGVSEIERLHAALPPDVLLVLDAAYAEYVDRPDYEAGSTLVERADNVVMTRTFSKIFGLGGVRLGWIYAPAAIIDLLNRARAPFNVSGPAHDAGLAALADTAWLAKSRAYNTAERSRMAQALTAAGLSVGPSETNFLLVDFGDEARAQAADAALQAHGVIVRRVGGYGLPSCLRITIGLADENDMVIGALCDFAGNNSNGKHHD